MSWGDENDVRELKGPSLAPGLPQTKYAPRLLEFVTQAVLDEDYVARLARHYELFKAHVDPGYRRRERPARKSGSRGWVQQNAPCPCESGRKYKNCCGARVRI